MIENKIKHILTNKNYKLYFIEFPAKANRQSYLLVKAPKIIEYPEINKANLLNYIKRKVKENSQSQTISHFFLNTNGDNNAITLETLEELLKIKEENNLIFFSIDNNSLLKEISDCIYPENIEEELLDDFFFAPKELEEIYSKYSKYFQKEETLVNNIDKVKRIKIENELHQNITNWIINKFDYKDAMLLSSLIRRIEVKEDWHIETSNFQYYNLIKKILDYFDDTEKQNKSIELLKREYYDIFLKILLHTKLKYSLKLTSQISQLEPKTFINLLMLCQQKIINPQTSPEQNNNNNNVLTFTFKDSKTFLNRLKFFMLPEYIGRLFGEEKREIIIKVIQRMEEKNKLKEIDNL